MKKILITCFIFFTIHLISFGQIAKMYVTKDDNGKEEYLLHHLKKNTFTYFSSENPKGVLLEIKKETGNHYLTSFPNSADIYELEIEVPDTESNVLHCTNPNGTKQDFYNPLYTNCYQFGQGNAQETIFGIGPPIIYVYYSTRFPNGVLLKIVGGDMEKGLMKVSFPDDKKVYELTESASNLKCKNPDGTIQTFQIKK